MTAANPHNLTAYKMCDAEIVAATSEEEARNFYASLTGLEGDDIELERMSAEAKFTDEGDPTIQTIGDVLAKTEKFPALIGVDGHYAT